MIHVIKEYIRKNQIIRKGDKIVAGISGGADSVCLLYVLKKLQEEYSLRLFAVHVNHGIRGSEAEKDSLFAEKICRELGVAFRLVKTDVPALAKEKKMSEEEAGRHARYQIFEQIRMEENADKIAVAHHKDDNAETILWNMLRGSGLSGLSGMAPVRDNIIRPLLCVTRKEIEEFLNENKAEWITDSTNSEIKYTRNKLRLQLIPWIEENLVQGISERLTEEALLFGEADRYLDKKAEEFTERYAEKQNGFVCIPLEPMRKEDRAVIRYVLRKLIKMLCGSLKDITAVHIQSILELEGVGKQISLPYQMEAKLGYRELYLGRLENMYSRNENELSCQMECKILPYKKEMKIPKTIYTKWFDYDKIKSTAILRTRKKGDRIQVLPYNGSKKLKDYMIDAKIPKELRDRIPLIADESDIMWIVGYRISEAYKVTEATSMVMQIKILDKEDK